MQNFVEQIYCRESVTMNTLSAILKVMGNLRNHYSH